MMTIDDCNTVMGKYQNTAYWHCIDFSKIEFTQGQDIQYDFCKLRFTQDFYGTLVGTITINNSLWHGFYYFTQGGGLAAKNLLPTTDQRIYQFRAIDHTAKLYLYLTPSPVEDFQLTQWMIYNLFLPKSQLQVPVIGEEFDDKFYIEPKTGSITGYEINGESVTLEQDDKGSFLRLPSSARDCIISSTSSQGTYDLYRVTFQHFKPLPKTLKISTLYKGNSQKIRLYDQDRSKEITLFQAYYQGRRLKDNVLELSSSVSDSVNIVIELKDKYYHESNYNLTAPVEVYTVTDVTELKQAINQGFKYLKISFNSKKLVKNLVAEDVTFVTSNNPRFQNCTFTNVKFRGFLRTVYLIE